MNDNNCGRVLGLLSEYLDRELASATCDQLEEHLRGCPECLELVRSLRRSLQLCRQLGDCLPMPPPLDREAIAGLRRAYGESLARTRVST